MCVGGKRGDEKFSNLKESYNENLYTHYLRSSVNICVVKSFEAIGKNLSCVTQFSEDIG